MQPPGQNLFDTPGLGEQLRRWLLLWIQVLDPAHGHVESYDKYIYMCPVPHMYKCVTCTSEVKWKCDLVFLLHIPLPVLRVGSRHGIRHY